MLNLQDEPALGLAQAAKLFPSPRGKGGHVSPVSVWRWMVHGLRVGGQIVKLDSVRIGGGRLTNLSSVQAFIAALQGAPPKANGNGENVAAEEAAARAAVGLTDKMNDTKNDTKNGALPIRRKAKRSGLLTDKEYENGER